MPAPKLDYTVIAKDYLKLKAEVKKKDEQISKYRDLLLSYVKEMGEEDEGHNIHVTVGDYIIHDKKRVTQKLDEEKATSLLQQKGIYEHYVSVTLDEDKVSDGILSGVITKDEAIQICQSKVSDVLSVEKLTNIEKG